jgi:hypothetical protein
MRTRVRNGIWIVLCAALGLAFAWAAHFVYEEARRSALIDQYRAGQPLTAELMAKQGHDVSGLMRPNERLVCVLHAYGLAEDLGALSEHQRRSLPKRDLPSEDMSWYLLFFDERRVTRIHLFESAPAGAMEIEQAGCAPRGMRYWLQGERLLVLGKPPESHSNATPSPQPGVKAGS